MERNAPNRQTARIGLRRKQHLGSGTFGGCGLLDLAILTQAPNQSGPSWAVHHATALPRFEMIRERGISTQSARSNL